MAGLHVTTGDGTREGSLEQTASVLGYRGDRTHERDLRGLNKAQGMLLQEKNLYLTMTVGDDTEKPWHDQKGSHSPLLANWSHVTFRFTLVATLSGKTLKIRVKVCRAERCKLPSQT